MPAVLSRELLVEVCQLRNEIVLNIERYMRRRARRRQKQKRRWNVRPLHQNREETGEFFVLVLPMRQIDEEKHFGYFRMTVHRFDELARRIKPFIKHSRTHRSPVSLEERLACTLRILATGSSQTAVASS